MRMRKQFSLSQGFTLIELIISLAILGVLAAALITMLNPFEQVRKSNDAKRKTSLEQMQRALEMYYQDNGRYPVQSADFKISVNNVTIPWGSAWSPYLSKLPSDPNATKTYIYYSPAAASGQTYYIYANLERGAKDPQACNNGLACTSITSGGPATNACGGLCNYGVSSPNVVP